MYAMCHTKSNDVSECVKEMKKQGVNHPILQVGQKLYRQCEKDHSIAVGLVQSKESRYTINMSTRTVHKKDCCAVKCSKSENLVNAYIVRLKNTGLILCGRCFG